MKKKERAHLKEDPFINFIEKILEKIRKYKREILFGVFMVVVLAIIIAVILFIRSRSTSRENRLFTQALNIKNSEKLDTDQKIAGLKSLNTKKGISASAHLFIATLYFKKGEIEKAAETLETFPGSKLKIINDQKMMLEAEILNATGKERESIDILNKLLADGKSEIAKDYLLLRIAKIQTKAGQEESAGANLNKLVNEFPESIYAQEARRMLNLLEETP